MSQGDKSAYYNALKTAGVEFSKHYREYSTDELREAYDQLAAEGAAPPLPEAKPKATRPAPRPAPRPAAPVARRNPNELPGQRLNTNSELEPIRTDPETGVVWYQEEVAKPAFPKPRGRRVLKYMETGVEKQTVQNGEYVETFEVAGTGAKVPGEVKVTLPSYQVGIYKDPRMPFKIYVYNDVRGFDLFEVENYFGGSEMVPAEVKRMYVANVLCYDIRSTVRWIQAEYRRLQLAGKVD